MKFALLAAALGILGSSAQAGLTSFVPPGLVPGDTYQLIFVTCDGTPATSTDIAFYNAFVTAEAALNPLLAAFDAQNGVTWTAIGSTAGINANVNAPSSGNVFNMNGDLVANTAQPLYGDSLYNPIAYNQFGNAVGNIEIWTGNIGGGVGYSGHTLGSSDPIFGAPGYVNYVWEIYADGAYFGLPPTASLPLYAISSVIEVTPEPGTSVLTIIGFLLIFAAMTRSGASGVSNSN